METGGKRKNKHELTEKETDFYKELSTALFNVRSASGISVYEMAQRCGYSEVHMRKLENFGVEKVSPIPAYILAIYAESCNVKLDDFCGDLLHKKGEPLKKEAHAKKIKYYTVGENDFLQKMREFKQIGGSRVSNLLQALSKEDLEMIYCLKKLERSADNGFVIGENIRHMVYRLYMRIGNDSKTARENITKK